MCINALMMKNQQSKCCSWSPQQGLPSNTNQQAPDRACWCGQAASRCPDAGALSLRAAPATVAKIDSTAAASVISAGLLPVGCILIRNAI